MIRLAVVSAVALAVAASSAACSSGIRVRPVSPPAAIAVSAVVVDLAPEVKGKKESILVKLRAQQAMGLALRDSTLPGGTNQLIVTITKFRSGRWGPTFMHAVADLVDAQGNPQGHYEAHSQSAAGSRKARIQKVAQQIVVRLVSQMPR